MSAGGFAGPLPLARFTAQPRALHLQADADARARIAARFGLVAIDHLAADLLVWRADGGVTVEGGFTAGVVQCCAVSGAPVPARIGERIAVRFRPLVLRSGPAAAGEIELDEEELDLLPLPAEGVDLGELVAQSLALALDPYPLAADDVVEAARRRLARKAGAPDDGGAAPLSPFAGLKGRSQAQKARSSKA